MSLTGPPWRAQAGAHAGPDHAAPRPAHAGADVQDSVLALEAVDGAEPIAERTLRSVAHADTWAEQRTA